MRVPVRFPAIVLGLLASAPLGARAASQVIVVAAPGTPGVAFHDVASAVAAAADGDVILLRPGSYGALVLAGKAISVVGEFAPTEPRPVVQSLRIENVAAPKRAVVRGLTVESPFGGPLAQVVGCGGTVVLEDLAVLAPVAPGNAQPSLFVVGSAAVEISRCTFTGGRGSHLLPQQIVPPAPGLLSAFSSVAAYDCSFAGGGGANAGQSLNSPAQAGAAGVAVHTGAVFLSGCSVAGGKGGAGLTSGATCLGSGDGGAGVLAGGSVKLLACAVQGGVAGLVSPGCALVGLPGPAALATTGTIASLGEQARTLALPSPLREGQVASGLFAGAGGEVLLLFASVGAGPLPLGGIAGVLLPAPPLSVWPVGPLPIGGEAVVPLAIPPGVLPPGVDAVELFAQAAGAGAAFGGVLSGPSVVAVVR